MFIKKHPQYNSYNLVIVGNGLLFEEKSKPSLLIANTIKGKGIQSMENKFESHYEVLDEKKYLDIIKNYQ